MQQPAIPNPNLIPISPTAQAAICAYVFSTIRKGYSSRDYQQYQRDWTFFNTVWSYNYTVSTLNGQMINQSQAGTYYQPWQFTSGQDRTSYSNGQAAHVAVYPSTVTVFNNIQF